MVKKENQILLKINVKYVKSKRNTNLQKHLYISPRKL